ncbi:hypothetical protein THITH_10105 [Thioalkalivibrio paradoxus ARh 1]|uniref:Uncharacterized protein n=1 Tax=Thioalkalivibrio paradoxus ARh 1 TaxID=713585 RepID=W0DNU4_9GAMM|nr:hypothetical protein THITH_10105 [Thioalkalivibrio paradoxus ARh 1]
MLGLTVLRTAIEALPLQLAATEGRVLAWLLLLILAVGLAQKQSTPTWGLYVMVTLLVTARLPAGTGGRG